MSARLRTVLRMTAAMVLVVCLGHPQAQSPASPGRAAANEEELKADRHLQNARPREALVELARADAAYRRAGDVVGQARVALKRSRALMVTSDLGGARRAAEEARTRATGDPPLHIDVLTHVARLATDTSDFAHADNALREALTLAEASGSARAEASVLLGLGMLEDRRGRADEAIAYLRRAAAAADTAGDVPLRVRTRSEISVTSLGLSRYDEALAAAEQSFAIADGAGTPALRARALFSLAQAHAHVWNLDRAAELWTATIDAYRALGDQRTAALATKQAAETWFALGELDRAAADGQTAASALRETGLLQYVAETSARVALSEARRGRLTEAREWAARARADLAGAPESRHLFVHNDLGLVEDALGESARARADFARVLDVARRVGNIDYEWRAHWGEGRVRLREDPAAAVAPLERAISLVERLRQTIPAAGLRAAFMINRVAPYETLVEAYMATAARDDDAAVRRAFEAAERARSRALADVLAEARARMTDAPLAAIRDEEIRFGARFSAAQKRVVDATNEAARRAALDELQTLEREYEALVVRIRRENPAYAALAHPRALTFDEIAATLAADEAIVEFLMTEQQGFAWIVRRDGIHGYRVPGSKALDPQVRLMGALLAARDDLATERLGASLYGALLRPAGQMLGGVRRLIVVPDGPLQRLPFALLRSNDQWLIESRVLTLAPSATILQYLRERRGDRAPEPLLGLAVASPPAGHEALFDGGLRPLGQLPFVADEVRDVQRLVGGGPDSVRVGPDATEHALKGDRASRYRILHFAAHAIADEIVPRRSAILLNPSEQDDGFLQMNEIANLSLNADLVVLAACRSHIGRLVRGEGLLGLSRAFMHAGARAVVATAWAVGDRETSWLMSRFYAELRDGVAPDEALRRAQLAALGSSSARATPATWAAFVAFGDAGTPVLEPAAGSHLWIAGTAAITVVLVAVLAAARSRGRRAGTRFSSTDGEAGGR